MEHHLGESYSHHIHSQDRRETNTRMPPACLLTPSQRFPLLLLRTQIKEWHHPPWIGSSHISQQSRQLPHRHTHKTNLTQVVPRMRLSAEVTLSCDKLTFKLTSTIPEFTKYLS